MGEHQAAKYCAKINSIGPSHPEILIPHLLYRIFGNCETSSLKRYMHVSRSYITFQMIELSKIAEVNLLQLVDGI